MSTTSDTSETLREAWERESADWIDWARLPDQDPFFWRFNLPNLLAILPGPNGKSALSIAEQ